MHFVQKKNVIKKNVKENVKKNVCKCKCFNLPNGSSCHRKKKIIIIFNCKYEKNKFYNLKYLSF